MLTTEANYMQSFNLTSYALALALLLAMIFTVSVGVRQLLVKLTESQKVSTQPGKRVKFSL